MRLRLVVRLLQGLCHHRLRRHPRHRHPLRRHARRRHPLLHHPVEKACHRHGRERHRQARKSDGLRRHRRHRLVVAGTRCLQRSTLGVGTSLLLREDTQRGRRRRRDARRVCPRPSVQRHVMCLCVTSSPTRCHAFHLKLPHHLLQLFTRRRGSATVAFHSGASSAGRMLRQRQSSTRAVHCSPVPRPACGAVFSSVTSQSAEHCRSQRSSS